MKRIILGILLSAVTCCYISAQEKEDVKLDGVSIQKKGDHVEVSFKAYIGRKATKRNYKLVLTPTLYKGEQTKVLKPIVVETRATKIMDARERISWGKRKTETSGYKTVNGSDVTYFAQVPYEEWMNGSSLRMDRLSCGCCDEAAFTALPVATDLALLPPIPAVIEKPVVKVTPKLRQWNFSKEDMIIDFAVSSIVIDPELFKNREILGEIIAAVHKIQSTPGTNLNKIEIVGYASPEGSIQNNQYLGENRSKALQAYIQKEIPTLPDSLFERKNGGENWQGLRKMIEASDMKYKNEAIYIIDHVPAEINYAKDTSRKKSLMDLKGGVPYNYMLKNFFPRLRNACYISIYYLDENPEQE